MNLDLGGTVLHGFQGRFWAFRSSVGLRVFQRGGNTSASARTTTKYEGALWKKNGRGEHENGATWGWPDSLLEDEEPTKRGRAPQGERQLKYAAGQLIAVGRSLAHFRTGPSRRLPADELTRSLLFATLSNHSL